MNVVLLLLSLGIGFLEAAEKDTTSDQAVTRLMEPLLEGGSASEEQYDAYRKLVGLGPEGWERLFRVLCDTDGAGDAARKTDSLWESGSIPPDLIERFQIAKRAEITRHASNESWALLYAGAYLRAAYRSRGETGLARLDRHFSAIGKQVDRPADALIDAAFLRVRLLEMQDFPGHQFFLGPTSPRSKRQRFRNYSDGGKSIEPILSRKAEPPVAEFLAVLLQALQT